MFRGFNNNSKNLNEKSDLWYELKFQSTFNFKDIVVKKRLVEQLKISL